MSEPQLSLEQQFGIRSFENQVQHLSHKECQELLVNLFQQMTIKDATYKELIGKQWGIIDADK